METEKGKFDKIIDILFPLDMSCFFDIRRMETSIKVMLVAFIFVGFIIKSMDVVEMLNIQDLTLSMMCVIMVVSCVVLVSSFCVISLYSGLPRGKSPLTSVRYLLNLLHPLFDLQIVYTAFWAPRSRLWLGALPCQI